MLYHDTVRSRILTRVAAAFVASATLIACNHERVLPTIRASTDEESDTSRIRTQRCAEIVWSADHETGDLGQWYADVGGGEFNSGTGTVSVSQDAVRSGKYALKTIIQAPHPSGQSAVRLFRWKESHAYDEACYSAWYYFPQRYVPAEWWNIFSFKSRNGENNDAFWQLQIGNRASGEMYLYLTWWGAPLEGPHPGESGLRHYPQWLKDVPVGRWTHLQVYLRQSRAFDGQIVVWEDGVALFNLNNVRTRYPDAHGQNEWSVNNYSDRISPTPTTFYIDDATISIPAVGRAP
jgi:Polysaccharide lyase